MGEAQGLRPVEHSTLLRLSTGLCDHFRGQRNNGSILRIAHGSFREAGARWLEMPGPSLGLSLGMTSGTGLLAGPGGQALHCHSAELPFVDAAFRTVILFHVIAAGVEAELAEACRVLAPGGDLLIVGLNHTGWVGIGARRLPDLPRLRAVRVGLRLCELGMVVRERLGAGLLGRSYPAQMARGWQRLAQPVADILLLCARHEHLPMERTLNVRNVRAGLAPTALAGR